MEELQEWKKAGMGECKCGKGRYRSYRCEEGRHRRVAGVVKVEMEELQIGVTRVGKAGIEVTGVGGQLWESAAWKSQLWESCKYGKDNMGELQVWEK